MNDFNTREETPASNSSNERPVAAGHISIDDTDHMVSMTPPQRRGTERMTQQPMPEEDVDNPEETNLPNSRRTAFLERTVYHPPKNSGAIRNRHRFFNHASSLRSVISTDSSLVAAIRDRERTSTEERGVSRLRREASVASVMVEERELGGRIKKTSESVKENSLSPTTKKLAVVGVVLFSSLALVFITTYMVLKFALDDPYSFYNVVDSSRSLHLETVRNTIPFVEKWYRDYDEDNQYLLGPPLSETNPPSTSCLNDWFDEMETTVPRSDPSLIEFVVQNMGLSGSPLVMDKLGDLLEAPQPLNGTYAESRECLASNPGVASIACILQEESPWNLTKDEERHASEYVVHFAAVQEVLSRELQDDPAALYQVIEIAESSRHHELERLLSLTPDMDSKTKDLFRTNYQGALQGMHALGKAFVGNEVQYRKESLQLKILQAVKMDVMLGHEENARLGLALAATVQFDPYVEGNQLLWRLGESWVRDYVVWQAAFLYGSFSLAKLPTILIPSVICTVGGETFVARSTISAGLDAMHQIAPPVDEIGLDKEQVNDIVSFGVQQSSRKIPLQRFDVASAMGRSNLNHANLLSPSRGTLEKMFYTLCGGKCHDGSWGATDTSPQSSLDDAQFRVYVGFILWITVLIAGLGMELLVWLTFLRYGWSKKLEDRWKFAQFVFPVFAATTLGLALERSYLALPFLVLGLWKFGFPETLLYMYIAIYDDENAAIDRITDFIEAVGTIVHHGAASFLITMCLAAVIPPDRHVVDPILILLMQHWFVLFAYVSRLAYIALELLLEVYFEWTVISNLQYLYALHWTASLSAGVMLVAHWFYLIGAGLGLVGKQKSEASTEEKEKIGRRVEKINEETDEEAVPYKKEYQMDLETVNE